MFNVLNLAKSPTYSCHNLKNLPTFNGLYINVNNCTCEYGILIITADVSVEPFPLLCVGHVDSRYVFKAET